MPLVASFSDHRAAFRFVSEVRRLYDVSRWADSEVVPLEGGGAVVHLASPSWVARSLGELAIRFGGDPAATAEEGRRIVEDARHARQRQHRTSIRETMGRTGEDRAGGGSLDARGREAGAARARCSDDRAGASRRY